MDITPYKQLVHLTQAEAVRRSQQVRQGSLRYSIDLSLGEGSGFSGEVELQFELAQLD